MTIPYVTQGMIFSGVLNIAPERWPNHAPKLAAVLAALGWKSKRQEVGGTKVTTYYPAGYKEAPPQPAPTEPEVTPRILAGVCAACRKAPGRGPDRCQTCYRCGGCPDTPNGVTHGCTCEAG